MSSRSAIESEPVDPRGGAATVSFNLPLRPKTSYSIAISVQHVSDEVPDLTEDDHAEQAWNLFKDASATPQAENLARLESSSSGAPKTDRQRYKGNSLLIDGHEKWYKPSSFWSRPAWKSGKKGEGPQPAWSCDHITLPSARESKDDNIRRSERNVYKYLDKVADTHAPSRVTKSVKVPKSTAAAGSKINAHDVQKGIANGTAQVVPTEDPGYVSSDDGTHCICRGARGGPMVCCDNAHCRVGWHHFVCVGIARKPQGEWFCLTCRVARSDAIRQAQGEADNEPAHELPRRSAKKATRTSITSNPPNPRLSMSTTLVLRPRSVRRSRSAVTGDKSAPQTAAALNTVNEDDKEMQL